MDAWGKKGNGGQERDRGGGVERVQGWKEGGVFGSLAGTVWSAESGPLANERRHWWCGVREAGAWPMAVQGYGHLVEGKGRVSSLSPTQKSTSDHQMQKLVHCSQRVSQRVARGGFGLAFQPVEGERLGRARDTETCPVGSSSGNFRHFSILLGTMGGDNKRTGRNTRRILQSTHCNSTQPVSRRNDSYFVSSDEERNSLGCE